MPNSHGAPEPSARSRKRRDAVPRLREGLGGQVQAAGSEPVWRTNHERIQAA